MRLYPVINPTTCPWEVSLFLFFTLYMCLSAWLLLTFSPTFPFKPEHIWQKEEHIYTLWHLCLGQLITNWLLFSYSWKIGKYHVYRFSFKETCILLSLLISDAKITILKINCTSKSGDWDPAAWVATSISGWLWKTGCCHLGMGQSCCNLSWE